MIQHNTYLSLCTTALPMSSISIYQSMCLIFSRRDIEIFDTRVGKPGKQKKKLPYIASGAMIDDWHTCVKNLNVSSRENQAHRLVDGNGGHWQSCGTQGKVCIMLNH
jgi:hypothetical protein